MRMRYEAILFDFDYTLGDSTEGIVLCTNTALKAMGLEEKDWDTIRGVIGFSLPEKYRRLTGDDDRRKAKRFTDLFIEAADRNMTLTAEFYPYSLPMIKAFRRDGIKVGVITTKYRRRIVEILDKYNEPDLLDIIIGGDSVRNPKPDPEGIVKAMKKLHVPASKTLYIGDSEVDAMAAQSAGVDFVGVLTGMVDYDTLSKYPNKAVIDTLEYLPDVLM